MAVSRTIVGDAHQASQRPRSRYGLEFPAFPLDQVLDRDQFGRQPLRQANDALGTQGKRQPHLARQHALPGHAQMRARMRDIAVNRLDR
ncbi:hypothetical protein J4558_12785 [Leptolyngbya sp. 15MV]|nr:hypothetical protein J4558_12785 [Leptolyngbya sp. 15MV]